jgi:hypothetical protein
MGTIEEALVHEIFIRYNLQVLRVDINVCCDNIQNVVGVHVMKTWPIFRLIFSLLTFYSIGNISTIT